MLLQQLLEYLWDTYTELFIGMCAINYRIPSLQKIKIEMKKEKGS